MIWHILRYWITFIIPSFYKKIQAKNLDNLKRKGPVIICMNHPNAFTDPILLTYLAYPQRLKFLARGDAFKPGIVSGLLESIGIIPIYRIQDAGKEGLKKNDESYRRVNYFLSKGEKVIVFAEGLCIQERRLRPLKKGVARMVFGAYEALKDERLVIIPVCVNYSQPDKFRSTAFYNIGEPIAVKDFIAGYSKNQAIGYNRLLEVLTSRMKALLTHIQDPKNDEIVYRVETMCKYNLIKERGLDPNDLESEFIVLSELTNRVNEAALQNSAALEEFRVSSAGYFSDLKTHGFRDWLLDPLRNKNVNFGNLIFRGALLVIGAPLFVAGIAGTLIPMLLTDKLTRKIIREREFYSSFALALAMIFFLLYYILLFIAVYFLTAKNPLLALIGCAFFALCGWFNLYYHPFFLRTRGMMRLLLNPGIAGPLAESRKKLISLINNF